MGNSSTIYLRKDIIEQIKELKVSSSESYNDALERLIKYRSFDVSNGLVVFRGDNNVWVSKVPVE